MDSKWNWLSHKLILYAKKAFNIRYITLADGLLCAYYLCDHTQSLISVYILCKPTHCEYLSSVLWPWLMSLTLGSFHPEETACYPVIGSLFTELSTDWNPLRCVFFDHLVHGHPFLRPSDRSRPSWGVHGTTTLCMVTSRRPVLASSGPARRYSIPGEKGKTL